MSGSIPTSNVSFSGIVNAYNNVNTTNLSTTNISLSSFRSKSFSDSTTVPSSGAISLNSHFKGKTWGAPSLYTFSSHIFTNCGATGASGPTLSQCRSSYSPSWTDNTSYFNVTGVANGIQQWKVPATGTYNIDILGAKAGDGGGATGGYGNRLIAHHSLTQGEWIHILVGQMSADSPYGSGGGGGTFVIRSPYNTNASILIIAGGGGGIESGLTVHHGTYNASGGDFSTYSSATGGVNGYGGSAGHGQPGAGFLGDATGSFGHGGIAAKGFVNGGKGGTQYTDGGFGGGGSGGGYSNGGGGGYSGGASGDSHGAGTDGAGGGGSHWSNGISGTISMWPADNGGSTAGTGQGKVTITKL